MADVSSGAQETPFLAFWRKHWQWVAMGGVAVLALELGFFGFSRYTIAPGERRSFLDILYRTLQLFVMESGAVDGTVPWELEAARFLAPLSTAWAAVNTLGVLFRDRLQMVRLRLANGHVVVCGLGRKGTQLVQEFLSRGRRVVVIEQDGEHPGLEACRSRGVPILIGNAADEGLLRKARVFCARHVVGVCGEDVANAKIAMLTHRLVGQRPWKYNDPVRATIHVADLDLCDLLKPLNVFNEISGSFEPAIFNSYQNAARPLWAAHPPDERLDAVNETRAVHLIIAGFGRMGQSIALYAAKVGHHANGKKLHITVIDKCAKERQRPFYARYPQFDDVCEAEFLNGELEDPAILDAIRERTWDKTTLTSIYLCFDDDPRSLMHVLGILARLSDFPAPIFVRETRSVGAITLLEAEHLGTALQPQVHSFGVATQTCTTELLLDEKLDRMAKCIQEDYVANQKEQGKSTDEPSMRAWPMLDHTFKDSCRQQADHLAIKLRAIGCYSERTTPSSPPNAEFTDLEIELMAGIEHARWTAERFLDGWTLGPRDPQNKKSPYLVAYEELPEDTKEYDRETVRNIPRLLALIDHGVYRESS